MSNSKKKAAGEALEKYESRAQAFQHLDSAVESVFSSLVQKGLKEQFEHLLRSIFNFCRGCANTAESIESTRDDKCTTSGEQIVELLKSIGVYPVRYQESRLSVRAYNLCF